MEKVDDKESEIENKLLLILYEKLKKEGIQSISLQELCKGVGIKEDKVCTGLLYLQTKGLINFKALYGNNRLIDAREIKITKTGIQAVEENLYKKDKSSKTNISKFEGVKSYISSVEFIATFIVTLIFSAISYFLNGAPIKIAVPTFLIIMFIVIIIYNQPRIKKLPKINKKTLSIILIIIPLAIFLFRRDWESPKITIISPTISATESNYTAKEDKVTLGVHIEDNRSIASVYINGGKMEFVEKPSYGESSINILKVIQLNIGYNKIEIVAYDSSGNKSKKEILVTYVPSHRTYKGNDKVVVQFQVSSNIMIINGHAVQIDAPAEVKNGRIFLPLRAISEALGATVSWVAEIRGITVTLGDHIVGLQIGNSTAVVDGTILTLEDAPYIKNNRTMVPLRIIANSLGATVEWDPLTSVVTITSST
jgi:hypothetical protein